MEVTVMDAIEKVKTTKVDENVRDATKTRIGKGGRQGDVYLARIPSRKVSGPSLGRQLVEGTTRGSRHILEGDVVTFEGKAEWLPEWVDHDECLIALFFKVGEGGARLTHPEHADVLFAPGTTWGTWQQMDARTRRRVED